VRYAYTHGYAGPPSQSSPPPERLR
jgi:hypothetical protein